MSNTKNKNYYGFKQNKQENPYGRYTPGTVGKIAIAVTVPSAIIAFVSVMIALLTPMIQALMVTERALQAVRKVRMRQQPKLR